DVPRFRDIHVMRHARVVRNDEQKLAAALERADNGSTAALQYPDDHASRGRGPIVAQSGWPDVAADEHAIFMQSRSGGAFGNGNLLELRIVGLEKAFALAIHAY